MALLSSKTDLNVCSDDELNGLCLLAAGKARLRDWDTGDPIDWWPLPPGLTEWGLEVWGIFFGTDPFQTPRYCHATEGTDPVNALCTHVGATRQQGWTNRQTAQECVWVADQANMMPEG